MGCQRRSRTASRSTWPRSCGARAWWSARSSSDAASDEAALRLRGGPLHNISTRLWDGRHVAGKAASYDGVVARRRQLGRRKLAPASRRAMDDHRRADPRAGRAPVAKPRRGERGVRPGGTLVYTVATVTRSETVGGRAGLSGAHPEFQLEPFPHPWRTATTSGMLQIWPQTQDWRGPIHRAHGSRPTQTREPAGTQRKPRKSRQVVNAGRRLVSVARNDLRSVDKDSLP